MEHVNVSQPTDNCGVGRNVGVSNRHRERSHMTSASEGGAVSKF